MLSPSDLIRLNANFDLRLLDTRAAGWADDQPRSLREWATLPRADGGGLSASLGDIAWAMMRIDPPRWGRAMAEVLEVILPLDGDSRSLAVIPLLRSNDWSDAREAARAAWSARTEAAAAASRAAAAAARAAAEAAEAAEAEWAWSAEAAAESAAESAAEAAAESAAEAAWAAAWAAAEAPVLIVMLRSWEEASRT